MGHNYFGIAIFEAFNLDKKKKNFLLFVYCCHNITQFSIKNIVLRLEWRESERERDENNGAHTVSVSVNVVQFVR